jgi:hypothetical protein
MLFMVIEHFRNNDPEPIGVRFQRDGRMLPKGVTYHASWIDPRGARCFQVMEAERPELLDIWIDKWNDLADFEVIPVLSSANFWNRK